MVRPFSEKKYDFPEIKSLVAERVWQEFITTDMNPRVIIDAGSSAEAIARVIETKAGARPTDQKGTEATIARGKGRHGFVVPSVFTHNLGAWQVLSRTEKIEVYLIGGRYNPDLNAIIEPRVFEDQLKLWSPNIAVIAVSGIDQEGLYCSNIQDEHPVKEKLAQKKVERRLIICDHSKIGRTDTRKFISLGKLKRDCAEVYLITDKYNALEIEQKYLQTGYNKTLDKFRKIHGEHNVIEVEVGPESVTSPTDTPDSLPPNDLAELDDEFDVGSTTIRKEDDPS